MRKTDDEFLAEINPKYLRLSPDNQQLVKIRVKAMIDSLLAYQERPELDDIDMIIKKSNEVFDDIDNMKRTDD